MPRTSFWICCSLFKCLPTCNWLQKKSGRSCFPHSLPIFKPLSHYEDSPFVASQKSHTGIHPIPLEVYSKLFFWRGSNLSRGNEWAISFLQAAMVISATKWNTNDPACCSWSSPVSTDVAGNGVHLFQVKSDIGKQYRKFYFCRECLLEDDITIHFGSRPFSLGSLTVHWLNMSPLAPGWECYSLCRGGGCVFTSGNRSSMPFTYGLDSIPPTICNFFSCLFTTVTDVWCFGRLVGSLFSEFKFIWVPVLPLICCGCFSIVSDKRTTCVPACYLFVWHLPTTAQAGGVAGPSLPFVQAGSCALGKWVPDAFWL